MGLVRTILDYLIGVVQFKMEKLTRLNNTNVKKQLHMLERLKENNSQELGLHKIKLGHSLSKNLKLMFQLVK